MMHVLLPVCALGTGCMKKTSREIRKLAKRGTVFLFFGFQPGKVGFLPHGINGEEVIRLFGSRWELLWEREVDEAPCLRGPLKTARPTGFCLRKG